MWLGLQSCIQKMAAHVSESFSQCAEKETHPPSLLMSEACVLKGSAPMISQLMEKFSGIVSKSVPNLSEVTFLGLFLFTDQIRVKK